MILIIPDAIDKASLLLSEARTTLTLRQPVDLEPLLAAVDDLIDHAKELDERVAYCEMFHDDDDDEDEDDENETGRPV
jgi:hypothetical protein